MGKRREQQAVINNVPRTFRRLVKLAAKEATSLVGLDDKSTARIHDPSRSAITDGSRVANIKTAMKMAGHSGIDTNQG